MAADQLHFLLIPLMSESHIIPITDLAKSLAGHGARVSIVTTPLHAARYQPSIDNLRIQMIPLPLPCREAGLPEGCEKLDSVTGPELHLKFFRACEMLQDPLEDLIRRSLHPKPNCILSTSAVGWAHKVAGKFNMPVYVLETVSCFTHMCSRKLNGVPLFPETTAFRVPGIPHEIEITKLQLPLNASEESWDEYRTYVKDQVKQAHDSARAVLVNSFQELEPWYVDGLSNSQGKPVWCVGPLSLYRNMGIPDGSGRGNKAAIDEHDCRNWLDSMKPKSVIFACFGSLSRISAQQLKEIGLGLQASNHPFIWVIRNQDFPSEVEDWLAGKRFQESVEGRGLVIRGWAPQARILSHVAVGGFLTHCGWNSTLEGVSAGVPMITWPMLAEQFFNEKLIVDVLGIGVKIGVEKFGEFVEGDRVKMGILNLMEESETGMERRRRAEELAEKANRAVEEGGSSYLNLSMLIQDALQIQ